MQYMIEVVERGQLLDKVIVDTKEEALTWIADYMDQLDAEERQSERQLYMRAV